MPHTLSTGAVRPRERFDYWRDVICQVFVPLRAEPIGTPVEAFAGAVDVAQLHELQIVRVTAGGQRVLRRPVDDRDDLLVSIQLEGRGQVAQDGHEARLAHGGLALYDTTRPYELTFDDRFSQLVVQFPRQQLRRRGVDVLGSSARHVPGVGCAGVATALLTGLLRDGESVPADAQRQLSAQALDLLALALAPAGGPAGAEHRRIRERQRVLTHVRSRLDDPRLGVDDVARRLGVSSRYLQKLFAGTGATLGERIRGARLQRARGLLLQAPHLTVAEVAHRTGFADAAHFSRSFRGAFGTTPTAARREASGQGAAAQDSPAARACP